MSEGIGGRIRLDWRKNQMKETRISWLAEIWIAQSYRSIRLSSHIQKHRSGRCLSTTSARTMIPNH
jgi:hypothetical protein